MRRTRWEPRAEFSKAMHDRAAYEAETRPLGWWWLSFVDERRPEGKRFVGVAIVQGYGVASATMNADRPWINPGGATQAFELTGDAIPPETLRNRLLSTAELIEAGLV